MDVNDGVLNLINQLFRLGEHPTSNPHEAANALERAQALLLKHNLTRSQLTVGTEAPATDHIGMVDIKEDAGYSWKSRLANVIAKASLCYLVSTPSAKTMHLFGSRANVLAVVRMFQWTAQELERQALGDWRAYKADSGTEASRTWKSAFYDGAINTIRRRLQPPIDAFTAGTGRALVLANTAKVQAAVSKIYPHTTKGTHTTRRDSDGYGAGMEAGRNVRFGPQGAISGGQRALSVGH